MDSVRRLVRVYGNVAAIAKQLSVAHTTVGSWKKKLENGDRLNFNVETRLGALNPREEWSKELLFGCDDAMYSLPALLAINRCRNLGHLNISARRFPSSGPMTQGLAKGSIHLAVMSETLWESMKTDDPRTATVSTLVHVGDAPVHGVAGRQIDIQDDFTDMIVYYPAATALGDRISGHFARYGVRLKGLKPLAPSGAKTVLRMRDLTMIALIGSPLWVSECLGQEESSFQKISSSLLPPTPAVLAFHKTCPRAPLRLFLMNLDEVLANLRGFIADADWDLGSEEANAKLKQMVDYALDIKRHGDVIGKFQRDTSFFSVVSLWHAEVQTLSRALSGHS
jgi:hypothetical protein